MKQLQPQIKLLINKFDLVLNKIIDNALSIILYEQVDLSWVKTAWGRSASIYS